MATDFLSKIIPSTILYQPKFLSNVDNRDEFVKELHRALKPKGKLIISAPNKLYPMECEFHLLFLSYLPKSLADIYVRLSGKGNHMME